MGTVKYFLNCYRKKIAEESSNMLKLREEGLKLTQKYKIVATELRNLSTAISLNKRQYRLSQIKLSKIRSQHQMLVKRYLISFYLTLIHLFYIFIPLLGLSNTSLMHIRYSFLTFL